MANDKIVATLDGNFVRMIDVVENCNNHWCSKLDYKIKVLRVHARLRLCSEWVSINEYLCISTRRFRKRCLECIVLPRRKPLIQ
jgi:hypothetical protein